MNSRENPKRLKVITEQSVSYWLKKINYNDWKGALFFTKK